MATTTNYSWVKPTDGGSSGAWGALLNTVIDAIDAALFAVSTTATAALPKAGGTMTGNLLAKTATQTVTAMGNLTGAKTFDMATADVFTGTVTGTTTFTFSNAPTTGTAGFKTFQLTNPGAFVITWPASVKWPGGSAPTFTSSGTDVVAMYTIDAGTTWRVAQVMADSR